jgi:hypothetical protein
MKYAHVTHDDVLQAMEKAAEIRKATKIPENPQNSEAGAG